MNSYRFVQSLCVVLLSVLFFSNSALAYDRQKEEGFFRPIGLEKAPTNLENAYEASAAFPIGWSNCSGAYISPDGYFLTAYHCVLAALGLGDKYRQDLGNTAERVVVPQEEAIGKRYESWNGNFKVTVMSAGTGFSQFDERNVHLLSPSVIKEMQDVISTDWAILKVDNIEDHACLTTAPQTPQEGEYSWTIGYPAPTQRNIGERTDNRTKLVSFGKVAYSADEAEFYKTLAPLNQHIVLDFWKVIIDRGEFFITDSDSQGGNSGSPVINEASELTGVLVQGLLPSQEFSYQKYHTYSSGIIDLQFIRRSLGEEAFDSYFSCER